MGEMNEYNILVANLKGRNRSENIDGVDASGSG
jgi:hypothetical protein